MRYKSLITKSVLWVSCKFLSRLSKKNEAIVKESVSILVSMQRDYKLLAAGTLRPRYFRGKLFETSKEGAVWPSAAIMIIENAVERNPAIWNAPPEWTY